MPAPLQRLEARPPAGDPDHLAVDHEAPARLVVERRRDLRVALVERQPVARLERSPTRRRGRPGSGRRRACARRSSRGRRRRRRSASPSSPRRGGAWGRPWRIRYHAERCSSGCHVTEHVVREAGDKGAVMSKDERHRLSRRRFLGAVGASAGAVALDPAGAVAAPGPRGGARAVRPRGLGRRAEHFGRMFRLPAFARQTPKVEAALRELGRPGGLLDAADPLAAGPKALIVDLSLSANNPNNPTHTAGTTFFGQFLDHDMTFDATSRLGRATNPADARNFRTPALDLDSVYGAGPVAQQELYDPADHIKLKVESGGAVRGPAAPRRRRRDRRRSPQRRAPDHLRAALRVPALPQPRGRPRPRAGAADRHDGRVRRGAQAHDLALPVADRARVPAADRRSGDGRRRAAPRPALVPPAPRRGLHAGRVPDRHLPDGAQHGAARRTARTSPATTGSRSSASSSTPRRRAGPTPTTCAAARAPRAGSSAGRPSSTSATARSSRTRRSTRRSRRRCSPCRSAPSRRTTRRPRCPSATCCAT